MDSGTVGEAYAKSSRGGVIGWSQFVANLIVSSQICSDTHISCPRCNHTEQFGFGAGPNDFKSYDLPQNANKSLLTWIFSCPNCGHRFAPVDGSRFASYLEQLQAEREQERRRLRGNY